MKTFKKICSVIFLALGTMGVIGLLLTISIPDSASDAKMAAIVFGIIGAFLIGLGINLWDWTRIKIISGIICIIIGGYFLLGSITMLSVELSAGIKQVIYSVILLPVGVLLIIRQFKSDKELKSRIKEKTVDSLKDNSQNFVHDKNTENQTSDSNNSISTPTELDEEAKEIIRKMYMEEAYRFVSEKLNISVKQAKKIVKEIKAENKN